MAGQQSAFRGDRLVGHQLAVAALLRFLEEEHGRAVGEERDEIGGGHQRDTLPRTNVASRRAVGGPGEDGDAGSGRRLAGAVHGVQEGEQRLLRPRLVIRAGRAGEIGRPPGRRHVEDGRVAAAISSRAAAGSRPAASPVPNASRRALARPPRAMACRGVVTASTAATVTGPGRAAERAGSGAEALEAAGERESALARGHQVRRVRQSASSAEVAPLLRVMFGPSQLVLDRRQARPRRSSP